MTEATYGSKRVTRRAVMSRAAINARLITLPEGVTWLQIPGKLVAGEFPHCPTVPDTETCDARLAIHIKGGPIEGHDWEPDCTRAADRHDLHVAHIGPGEPVAAWTDDPELAE